METFITILIGVGILVGLPVVLLLLRDRIDAWRQPRPTPAELRAASDAWLVRLGNPELAQVEARLGAPVPRSVRRLYGNPELLRQQDLFFPDPEDPSLGEYVERFLPADVPALEDVMIDHGGPVLPFARTLTGGTYFVALGEANDEDGPVYLEDHGEVDRVCGSLDAFVAGLRPAPE